MQICIRYQVCDGPDGWIADAALSCFLLNLHLARLFAKENISVVTILKRGCLGNQYRKCSGQPTSCTLYVHQRVRQ